MNCAVCNSPLNVENAHLTHKGIGGRGPKAPADAHDTIPLCASTGGATAGNTDPASCHGAHHAGLLAIKPSVVGFRWMLRSPGKGADSGTIAAYERLRKRLGGHDGLWNIARYLDTDPDAIDCRPEEVTR